MVVVVVVVGFSVLCGITDHDDDDDDVDDGDGGSKRGAY